MTVAVAVTFPIAPVAVAVYVVVAVGVTGCLPPVGDNEYEVLSEPVIVTCVALVAATVSVDDPPVGMEDGFAMIVTVAGWPTVTVAVAVTLPVDPVAVAV